MLLSQPVIKQLVDHFEPVPPVRQGRLWVLPRWRLTTGGQIPGNSLFLDPPHPGALHSGTLLPPLGIPPVVVLTAPEPAGNAPAAGTMLPAVNIGIGGSPGVESTAPPATSFDSTQLFGYPIQFAMSAITAQVSSGQLGPFAGPAIIRDFRFEISGTPGTAQGGDVFRVDFSSVSGLDTFTRVAGDLPTGISSAQQTLFQFVSSVFGGTPVESGRSGWANFAGTVTGATVGAIWQNINYLVNLSSFYIKFYVCNDTAATEEATAHVVLAPLQGPSLGAVPPGYPLAA